MSLIGNIAGVPLVSTIREALAWATANRLSGYHRHTLNGQMGYMGGVNHQQAAGMPATTSRSSAPLRSSRSSRSSGSSMSSGSSGGGGY